MTTSNQTAAKSRWLVLATVATFIAGMVVLVMQQLPRGFDMDLDKLGDGKAAVVFVYDTNLSVSGVQAEEMDKIRDRFEHQVHFLVADIGRPQARPWISQYQARPAELLFFDAAGALRHRQSALLGAEEMAQTMQAVLNLRE